MILYMVQGGPKSHTSNTIDFLFSQVKIYNLYFSLLLSCKLIFNLVIPSRTFYYLYMFYLSFVYIYIFTVLVYKPNDITLSKSANSDTLTNFQ